jgi:hypothetical protein
MATIVTRAGKGSPLTHTEVDANFTNLNDEAATKAPLASPALTGTPTAPTATVGTNTTQIATTAFVIANAGSLDSPAFTGTPTAPTASVGTNTTQLATTAFVNAEIANDAPTKTGGGASGTWSININGTFDSSARSYSREWIEMPNYSGLYSPLNSAHFYPNNGSYGSWRISGTRNGWAGIEFENSGTSLMQATNGNTSGFHRNGYGWQFFWESGTLYCFKNTYGGGSQATVLDSVNYGGLIGGMAYGAVGTYAFLVFRGASFLSAGTNIAGSSLIPGGVYANTLVADNSVGNANGSALSTGSGALGGTWKAMGAVTFSSGSNFSRGTVFLRIS